MLAFFPLPKQLSVSFNKHVEGSRKSPSNSWNKDKKGSSCVNSMLFFTDVVEQHSFEVYARKETTSFSLCLLNLVLTGYFTYILSITYSAPLNFLSWTLISIAFIFVSMIALLVLFVSKRNINWLKFFEQKHWQEQSMENYFCLLLTITLGVVFYEREFYERKLLSTSSVTHNHFLATETLFLLFICPICLKIVFGQLYWSTELIMFAFSASFSCSAIGVFSATRSIALVIMTLVVIFAMMYLRRYQIIYTYYEKKRGLERTGLISTVRDMSEQEFSIAHSEAIEWRYLLANIAHDLKTVSSSRY